MTNTQNTAPLGGSGITQLFESLAESSWDWLGHARRLRMSFSEDTISDLTALEIARHYPSEITVKRVSKRIEGVVGFDWAWVFQRQGRIPAVYVVQAKKLTLDKSNRYIYSNLRYTNQSGYQIDMLQRFADKTGAVPLYCFYNNVDDKTASDYWHCREQPQPDPPQMGCTLVPLSWVRPIHNGPGPRDFYALHDTKNALPWRCILHPKCANPGMYRSEDQLSDDQRTRLNSFAEMASTGESVIDSDSIIALFDLDELVNRYVEQNILPVPERLISVRLGD